MKVSAYGPAEMQADAERGITNLLRRLREAHAYISEELDPEESAAYLNALLHRIADAYEAAPGAKKVLGVGTVCVVCTTVWLTVLFNFGV